MRIPPKLTIFLALGLLVSSCQDEKGPLRFSLKRDPQTFTEQRTDEEIKAMERELWLKKLAQDYETDLLSLELNAKESFASVKEIVQKKCSDCHDSRVKLPFYGRVLPRVNPVNKHQKEGLIALDFKESYPLLAKGDPPQLALLKAIKASVLDRSMPLKSYLIVYPWRRITKKNAKKLLDWVNPLIEEHERISEKYQPLFEAQTPKAKVERLFSLKCLRCHGNGNNRGGLGGLEDLEAVAKNPKLINTDEPPLSNIYKVCESGEMPTDPRERLTPEELATLLEWIETL